MWGTDRLPNLNQTKVTANPQDDFLKQKTNKKSGNWQKVMIFPVENTNTGRLIWEYNLTNSIFPFLF
jgi:hypothetical protein